MKIKDENCLFNLLVRMQDCLDENDLKIVLHDIDSDDEFTLESYIQEIIDCIDFD